MSRVFHCEQEADQRCQLVNHERLNSERESVPLQGSRLSLSRERPVLVLQLVTESMEGSSLSSHSLPETVKTENPLRVQAPGRG